VRTIWEQRIQEIKSKLPAQFRNFIEERISELPDYRTWNLDELAATVVDRFREVHLKNKILQAGDYIPSAKEKLSEIKRRLEDKSL